MTGPAHVAAALVALATDATNLATAWRREITLRELRRKREEEEGWRLALEPVHDGCTCRHTSRPPCWFCENATEEEFEAWVDRMRRR